MIGLTKDEIDKIIMRNGITSDSMPSNAKIQKAIVEAIAENNKKIFSDMERLISQCFKDHVDHVHKR